MERDYSDKFREVDTTPYIEDINDPVVKNLVRNSGADYAQRGIQQLTYLSSLHDDLVRRKSELEQERTEAENTIDSADKVKKIDKDIVEIDQATSDIKNQFNKAKNNPSEMVKEMIDAQIESAKVAIGQEAKMTKARYHQAKSLQDVADTFLYGNYNQSVLEEAIHEAKDEDNKKLLESFYPFSAEVNATEGAIDKVINDNAADEEDEVKNRAKAALGSFAQQAIDDTLTERADTGVSSTVADKLREYAGNVVAQADQNNPMDVMGAESTSVFLNEVADELDKARENAKVPEVKPAEAPKKTTESKPQPEPESGKKGEPQDAATQPEPAKKPETKKADTSEAEIKPVETPAPTPTTSAKKVGDSVTLTDGFTGTITSIPKAGVYEVALENGQSGIYTDENIVSEQPKEKAPEPSTQSPTGGSSQSQTVTPNREEGQEEAPTFAVGDKVLIPATTSDETDTSIAPFIKDGKIEATVTGVTDDGSVSVQYGKNNSVHAQVRLDKATKIEPAVESESEIQKKEEQAGESEQETRVTEPDTPEQEEKKEEARSGKSFTGTNFLTYEQTILGRKNPATKGVAKRRTNKSVLAFQALLTSKGIDIDHVVNNYMYDFMVDNKLPVNYMVMKDDNGDAVPSAGHEHIFLVTPITDKIQEFIEKDTKLQGNVKQMSDGSKMLVVGILGYGENDMDLANKAERIREAYRSMDENSKAKEYTIVNVPDNSIYAMNGGQMVLQFEGQERGDVDLKTLLDSTDSTVNPRQLKIGDIRFATAIGKEGEVKLRFFQKREGDDQYGFNNPLSLQGSPGNVWMFIRNAKGEFIPTPIAPTTWGDNNMNWDSELGRKIRSLVDSLATVTNKEDIPALLKELNQRLVFSINNRNMGNRLFYDEKTGELSFRRFNLDAASDNAKIILGDEESPFLVVDKSESLTLNLLNPERPMEESKQILYQMIEALDPVINIQNSVMASPGGIKMYLDAGLFKVGIKSLGVVNAKTYMYPINDHLEPIDGFVTPPVAPMVAGSMATFYYNGNRYTFSGEKLYDANFKEVTDPEAIQNIQAAANIVSGKVRPIRVNGTSYWEINGRVYSQYRNGGYAQLSPSEEAEYKQRKAAEANKKQKEEAARQEATRLDNQKTTQAKYKVGDNLNGRNIKEISIVDGEVIYTFDDAQNGIQNGTISQTELDTLLSAEAQAKAENSNKEVHQGENDSQKGVKKTEQESKTLAEKVEESRKNTTFADILDDDNLYNSLVSALESALEAYKQRTGESVGINFNDIDDIENFLVQRSLLSNPSQYSISELQALVERLNSCGF